MQDKRPINEKGEAHGQWEVYWSNGELCYIGNYMNGIQCAFWSYPVYKIYYAR
jgi:hypothetical protein